MMWKIFGKRRSYARNLKIVRNWNFCHIIDWASSIPAAGEKISVRRTYVDESLGCVSENGISVRNGLDI